MNSSLRMNGAKSEKGTRLTPPLRVRDRRPAESCPSQSGLVMSVTKVNEVTHLPALVPGRSLVYNGDGKWKGEITLSLWITAERRRMWLWRISARRFGVETDVTGFIPLAKIFIKIASSGCSEERGGRKLNYLVLMGFSIWLRAGRE